MPNVFNICAQLLDNNGQARPCPCRYTKMCPDSTIHCDYGEKYCMKCYTDADGQFHHTPSLVPCNTLSPLSRDCNICAFNYKLNLYSSLLGEYKPFIQCSSNADEDLPF